MPHNKPTVDRLPEPRYTLRPDTVRQMRTLAKRECANCFDDGNLCVMLDAPCFQSRSDYLACSYFKECVLPLDRELQRQATPEESRLGDKEKRCAACGKLFLPKGNRAKYCDGCKPKVRREKDAKRKRLTRHAA